MARIFIILLFCIAAISPAAAQVYKYDGKNDFAQSLTAILNQCNEAFYKLKGGRHSRIKLPGFAVHYSRYKLPNCKDALVYLPEKGADSTAKPYAEFTMYKVMGANDAEAAYLKATQTIQQTYRKKWMVYRQSRGSEMFQNGSETLFCYQLPKGFVYYSCRVLAREYEDSSWKIVLRIDGGEPAFFQFIPKNSPVMSDMFVHGFRKNYAALVSSMLVCVNNMPGYNCRMLKDSTGRERLEYYKTVSTHLEADFEYDVAMGNSKVGLGTAYVFVQKADAQKCRHSRFVHLDDIPKSQYAPVQVIEQFMGPNLGYEIVIRFETAIKSFE